MKKKVSSILVFTLLFALLSCNSDKSKIKTVVISFFTALNHKDPQSAKLYATKESADFLNLIHQQLLQINDTTTSSNEKFLVDDIKINGDIATAGVKSETQQNPLTVTLKKEKGEWKVSFDKKGIMGMMGNAENSSDEPSSQTPTAPAQTLQLSDSSVTPTRKDTQVLEMPK